MYARNAHQTGRFVREAAVVAALREPLREAFATPPALTPDMPLDELLTKLADRLDDTRSGVDKYAAELAVIARRRAAVERAAL